jgi:hypothetical protein
VVKGGTLTLPAITSDEAGVYSCVASNNVGNPAKKSTTIVVRGERGAGVGVCCRWSVQYIYCRILRRALSALSRVPTTR